jgi:Tfp pilus assembly protein PilN
MSSPNQLSFLPEDYLQRKAARRTNIICAGLFVVVMGAISSAFVVTEKMVRDVEKQHQEIDAQYVDAAKRIEQVKQMQDKQRKMALQAELTSSLLEKVPRSFLLAEITNSMPAGVSLLDFAMDSKQVTVQPPKPQTTFEQQKQEIENAKKGPPPPQPKTYEVNMKMTGVAGTDVQVAQLISKLSQSKLLKDVNLVISDEFVQGKDKLRKFQIEAMLNPAARVTAPDESNKTAAVELGTN